MKRYFSFALLLALMLSIFSLGYAQVDPVDTFPFVEDFETGQTHNTQVQGWTQILDNGRTKYWTANSTFTNYNRAPRNGSFNAFLQYYSNAWMMRPFILEGGVSYDVEVWARQDRTSGATLAMYYGDDSTIAAMTNTIVAEVNLTNGDYQCYSGRITPAASGTYWIAIHGTATYTPWYISIDDFMVKHTPTEPMFAISPTGYDFGSLQINTTGSQTFTIMNVGIGTLNVTGISPLSDGYFTVTDAPEWPVALTAGESATFTIQYAPTAAGDHSATFTITHAGGTESLIVSGSCYDPVIYDLPWIEDFTNTTFPPSNWSILEGLYDEEGFTTSPSSGRWTRSEFAHISNPSARINIYGTTTKHWLVTPPIVIPATGYQLDFDLALTKWNSTSAVDQDRQQDDKFIVFIADNPEMLGATALKLWDNAGSPNVYNAITTTGEYQAIDLSAHVGTRYIAFYGESTNSTGNNGGDNALYVDNVRVREIPTAPIFSYNPDAINFGIIHANTLTDYIDVNVSNIGSGTLTLDTGDVSLIGPDAVMFSFDPVNLSFNLATGQSGAIPVRYNPTVAGTHTATLRMVYNGENYDVALSGGAVGENALYESFEDATFPPLGWQGDWSPSTFYSVDGSKCAFKNGSESTQYVLSTPMLAIENDSRLNFWTRCTNSTAYLQVVYSTDRETWTQVGSDFSFAEPNAVNTWYNVDVDLSTLSGNNYYLGFRTGLTGGSYYVDMVVGPDIAAVAPGAPTLVSPADAATFVSVTPTFTWDAPTTGGVPTSYNIYCDSNNPPNTLIGSSTTTSFTAETALPYGSTLYWTVTAVNATGESAQATPNSFTTLPEGLVFIGDGTSNNYLPIYPYYNYSYSQTIYLQSDINVADKRIENIAFYWNGAAAGTASKDWVVYMAHTDKTAFSGATDWVPFNQLTQVFAGELDIPAEPGWVNINLQTPFVYNNTDNLLIAVDENTPGNSGSSPFFHSTSVTGTRALIHYVDGTNPNPVSPPEASYNGQRSAYANIRMQFGDLPTVPVFTYAPDAIDFGPMGYNVLSAPVNVTVSNTGSGVLTLNAADISIIGPNAADFSFGTDVLPANLGTGQSVDIPVTVQSTTEGPISATLRMTYSGENYDVALSANVLEAGLLIIGNGTDTNSRTGRPCVYGGYHKNGREQYIVTAAELTAAGAQAGLFDTIGFNVMEPNSSADLPDFTIKMAAIDATEFGSTSFYDDLTLTQVFFTESFTPVAGWNEHTLDTPFFWDGVSNIVIQTSYDMLTAWVYHAQTYHTDTTVSRTLYYGSDSTLWQDQATGTLSTKRPNMKLHITLPAAGAPAAPILASPDDGATGLSKYGFNLSWTPDLDNGGLPSYYAVFMNTDADAIYDGYMWETAGTSLNPVLADPPAEFVYGQRYYWTVQAINDDGDAVVDPPRSFVIEDDPSIVALPYEENFDAVVAPAFPRAWTTYKSNSGSTIETRTTQSQTPDNSVYMYTRTVDETMRLVTPPIAVPINTIKLSFWLRANGTTNYSMKVGTVNTYDGSGTFTQVAEIFPSSSYTWEQHTISFAGYTGTDEFICFQAGTDATSRYYYLDSIRFEALPAVDMQAISLAGPGAINVGQAAVYNLTVLNYGTEPTANYTVNLKDINDVLLATTTVSDAVAPGATAVVPVTWTPTAEGTYSIYAEVVAAGDEDLSNDATAAQGVTVYPATTVVLPVGDAENATTSNLTPFNSYWKGFVAETVYLASEIQASSGTIQSVAYYNDFRDQAWTMDAKIYMKNTDLADMSAGWPEFTGYTLVFDGTLDLPAGVNEVVIPLTTPFAYTGGNLSIRTTKTYQASCSGRTNYWIVTNDTNYPSRTRTYQSDSEGYVVPENPSPGAYSNHVPVVTFIMDPATVVNTVAAPEVSETALVGTNVALTWGAVPYAYSYKVYASEDPYNFGTEPTAIVYSNGATLPTTAAKGFYKVTANTYRDNNRGPSMWSRLLNANITENPIEKDKDLLRK